MTQLFDITLFSFILISGVAAYNVLIGSKSKNNPQLTISTAFFIKRTIKDIFSTMMQWLGIKQQNSAHLCKTRLDECCLYRNASKRIHHKE